MKIGRPATPPELAALPKKKDEQPQVAARVDLTHASRADKAQALKQELLDWQNEPGDQEVAEWTARCQTSARIETAYAGGLDRIAVFHGGEGALPVLRKDLGIELIPENESEEIAFAVNQMALAELPRPRAEMPVAPRDVADRYARQGGVAAVPPLAAIAGEEALLGEIDSLLMLVPDAASLPGNTLEADFDAMFARVRSLPGDAARRGAQDRLEKGLCLLMYQHTGATGALAERVMEKYFVGAEAAVAAPPAKLSEPAARLASSWIVLHGLALQGIENAPDGQLRRSFRKLIADVEQLPVQAERRQVLGWVAEGLAELNIVAPHRSISMAYNLYRNELQPAAGRQGVDLSALEPKFSSTSSPLPEDLLDYMPNPWAEPVARAPFEAPGEPEQPAAPYVAPYAAPKRPADDQIHESKRF